jgi:hypothetical protein
VAAALSGLSAAGPAKLDRLLDPGRARDGERSRGQGGLGASGEDDLRPAGSENQACRRTEPSPAAAAVPDPGHVPLGACERREIGPTGAMLRATSTQEAWVRAGDDGCLKYTEDPRGNRIPDFSQVGYHGGGVPFPQVDAPALARPVEPGNTGDDTPAIQAAIDAVSALPADARGFRGAVELAAGSFVIKGTLRILKGGVVLRGQGQEGPRATILRAVGNTRTVIEIGPKKTRTSGKTVYEIVDAYVPVGARSFELDRVTELKVGDDIVVRRPLSQRWICAIGLDGAATRLFPPFRAWKPRSGSGAERRIVALDGNRVTIDVPLTNALEKEYAQAIVTRYEFPERIAEVGVEDLAGRAEFVNSRENPGRSVFLWFRGVVQGWARGVTADGFANGHTRVGEQAKWVTVEDATFRAAPFSLNAFSISGQQSLLHRLRVFGDVRAFTMMSSIPGPNAVVDLLAVGKAPNVIIPMRWSHGVLLDNVRLQDPSGAPAGEINISNHRGNTHGWGGANCVVWNSHAATMTIDSPPTAQNWIVGGSARTSFGTGLYGLSGSPVLPPSLYRAQLAERLGGGVGRGAGTGAIGTAGDSGVRLPR